MIFSVADRDYDCCVAVFYQIVLLKKKNIMMMLSCAFILSLGNGPLATGATPVAEAAMSWVIPLVNA